MDHDDIVANQNLSFGPFTDIFLKKAVSRRCSVKKVFLNIL